MALKISVWILSSHCRNVVIQWNLAIKTIQGSMVLGTYKDHIFMYRLSTTKKLSPGDLKRMVLISRWPLYQVSLYLKGLQSMKVCSACCMDRYCIVPANSQFHLSIFYVCQGVTAKDWVQYCWMRRSNLTQLPQVKMHVWTWFESRLVKNTNALKCVHGQQMRHLIASIILTQGLSLVLFHNS